LQISHYAETIYYRDSCSQLTNGYPYKSIADLNKKLKKEGETQDTYDLKRTLLVDDLPINKEHNKNNCYQIFPWKVTGIIVTEEADDIILIGSQSSTTLSDTKDTKDTKDK